MAQQSVTTRLQLDISDFRQKAAAASAAARTLADQVENAGAATERSAQRQKKAMGELAGEFGKVGIAATAGLAATTKAAMDWETAWAGVTKTVNGTDRQLGAIESELRNMAKTMPTTHADIAAVAQAAGALGVKTKDVTRFTKTMIMLGEATDDLTPDQAATSMAQLMNVMQTAPDNVDNLAQSLVRLGNNGASTEGQILEMAQRIAGAGKTIGLSEADVMGIANALASVGIEAEAGGSAVSAIFMDMAKAAKQGAPSLKTWASTAGVTVTEFQKLMATSPADAFEAFVSGLGRVKREGGDVFTLLDSLGQSDVRVSRALLTMANSGDLLGDSLDDAADAFANGTDLNDEYAKRSATAASQVKIAWNSIKDNFIDVGASALPVVKELSGAVASMANAFSGLSPQTQGVATKVLAMTAALGVGALAVSKTQAKLSELGAALGDANKKALAMRGGAAAGGMALLSFADKIGEVDKSAGVLADSLGGAAMGFAVGGPWGAAIGGGIGLIKGLGDESRKSAAAVDALGSAFDAATGRMNAQARQKAVEGLNKKFANYASGTDMTGLQAAKKIGIDLEVMADAAMGGSRALDQVKGRIQEIENMSPKQFRAEADRLGISVGDLADIQAGLGDMVDKSSKSWLKAGENARLSAQAMSGAINSVGAFRKALAGVPKEVVTEIETKGYDLTRKEINDLTERYNLTPSQVQTVLAALDRASPKLKKVAKDTNSLNGKRASVNIFANTSPAMAAMGSLRMALGAMAANPIMIAIGARNIGLQADGSVMDFYANGGMRRRENHVAQIAPAGSWRVWAEPETGGEAYIPLAPGKRGRSRMIADETVARLGGTVEWFADGGFTDAVGGSEYLQLQKRVRDLSAELRKREKIPKSRRTRNVLRGFDRIVATQELKEARTELAATQRANKAASKMGLSYAAYNAFQASRSDTADQFRENANIENFTTPASVERALAKRIQEMAAFTQILVALKKKGASPWLLEQLQKAGPSRGSINLARRYLSDKDALKRVNALAGQASSVSQIYGQVAADPRFTQAKGWSGGLTAAQTRVLQVNVTSLDATTQARETARVLNHQMQGLALGAGV